MFMPLIDCPECGKPVSAAAHSCPICGYPIAEKLARKQQAATSTLSSPGNLLAEVRPSWWGFFWHLFFFWLIIPPIIAYFRRSSTILRIYPERINLERGVLSKCYRDFNPRDIRAIDVDQGFFDRLVDIGNITISTASTVEAAEQIDSIPNPRGVRDLIVAQRGNQ
jgi:membrane protein YdbS with pleckstrin-like domain